MASINYSLKRIGDIMKKFVIINKNSCVYEYVSTLPELVKALNSLSNMKWDYLMRNFKNLNDLISTPHDCEVFNEVIPIPHVKIELTSGTMQL